MTTNTTHSLDVETFLPPVWVLRGADSLGGDLGGMKNTKI